MYIICNHLPTYFHLGMYQPNSKHNNYTHIKFKIVISNKNTIE